MSCFHSQLDLQGRVAIVTGGGGGIGLAAGLLLAGAGARVIAFDTQQDRLAALGAAGRIEPERADISNEAAVVAAIDAAARRHGRIDILVNNAGVGARGASESLPLADWQRVLDVTLTGSFLCAREAGRHMLARGTGAIVNVASIMGLVGNAMYGHVAYHTAKGAVVNMTRALAVEWAPRGVRVNAVAPTFVETELTARLLNDPAARQAILDSTPMGRLATVDEVANAILFLASDMASMVTGQILAVDGGWLAR